jgi:hypothetical protein
MLKENIAAVELFSGIKVAGVINHIEDFSAVDGATLATIKNIVSL